MKSKNNKAIGIVLAAMMLISVFVAIAPTVSATQTQADDDTGTALEEIQKAIEASGANWTAGETSVSGLSVEEKKMRCGAKIGKIPEDAVPLSPPEVSYGTFDWRNVNGQNWVTSVKDQGACGSCWVFGSTAALETQINIDANDPTIDFDASDQNVLSCSGGGDCDGGWPDMACVYIRDNGVPDEACLPYQADDTIPCSDTCPDWQDRACTCDWVGVPTYHTTENYKAILQEYGPMVVVLNVGEDLFYYTGGIYESVWTTEEFGWADHCVMLVGYDDTNQCWIIKNSWGTGWGENGYGRVYYGNLEQYEYAFVLVDTSCPEPGPTPTPTPTPTPGECNILFDQGHNNLIDSSIGTWDTFIRYMRDQGYQVDILYTQVTPAILSDYDVFITPVPQTYFTSTEISAINNFIAAGNGALFIGDHSGAAWNGNMNSILSSYGITLNADVVYDPTNNDASVSYWPIIHLFATHPVTQGIASYVEYCGCSLGATGTAQGLAWGDGDSYVSAPSAEVESTNSAFAPEGGIIGETTETNPITLATWESAGRVAAIGDSNMFGDADIDYDNIINIDEYDNKEIILNLIAWLCGEGELQPDIRVYPTSFDVTLPPDTTWSDTLRIWNDGEATLTYDISDVETTSVSRTYELTDVETDLSAGAKPSGQSTCTVESMGLIEGLDILALGTGYSTLDNGEVARLNALGANVVLVEDSAIAALTLADLEGYDVVYLPVQWGYASAYIEAIGNTIKTYVSNGGGLVVGQCNDFSASYTPGFLPYSLTYTDTYYPDCGVTILDTTHYITNGLTGDDMPDVYDRIPTATLDANYDLLAKSSWENVLSLAVADYGSGRIAVHTSLWSGGGTVCEDDPDVIIERIFYWTSQGDAPPDCPWLDETPTSGSVPPGGYNDITVTIDTTGLAPNGYSANIIIDNNDPDENPTIVPVSLTVREEGPTENEVYLDPQASRAPYCSTTPVEIWVNATDAFQSGQIKLVYNPGCANVTNWARNTAIFPMGFWTHSVGEEWIGFTGTTPLTGEYLIGTLTIHCVSEEECSTALDFITPSALFDPYGSEIPGVTWTDGTFECGGVCGDVNCDDNVNMGDVVLLLNHVGNPGQFPICDDWAADVNCDGNINMGDVVLLLNHVGNPVQYPLNCCE